MPEIDMLSEQFSWKLHAHEMDDQLNELQKGGWEQAVNAPQQMGIWGQYSDFGIHSPRKGQPPGIYSIFTQENIMSEAVLIGLSGTSCLYWNDGKYNWLRTFAASVNPTARSKILLETPVVYSKGFWQWRITLRITSFVDFTHCPEFWILENTPCKIWDFDGGDYEKWCLLGCYAVWRYKNQRFGWT
jgi:hypothetical protein